MLELVLQNVAAKKLEKHIYRQHVCILYLGESKCHTLTTHKMQYYNTIINKYRNGTLCTIGMAQCRAIQVLHNGT